MSSWLWWTGLFLLLALGPTTLVLSQDQFFSELGDNIADADEAQTGAFYDDQFTGRSGQAMGAMARIGYLTGPAVGREKGLLPLELMPYFFMDNGMFFIDFRGFRNDADKWGMNSGGGFRYYVEPLNRIFGFNAYHDYDQTSGVLFRQWGFGIETLGEWFDARANAYFPYGERSQFLGSFINAGSQRFVDNRLLFSLTNQFGATLRGADAELGVPLPGPFLRRHDARLFAGGYVYDSDATGSFSGWSGRLQGNPIPSLLLQLMVTHDPVFDTNVVFSAAFSFGGYRQEDGERPTQFGRMTTPVQRQYNIAVARTNQVLDNQVAINPVTGDPYFFKHVASYADPGGDGTFENPFQTINQTTPNNPGDIVFVWADSVYTGAIQANDNILVMEPGTSDLPIRYLGDGTGIVHQVNAQGLGLINLPSGTTGINRPQLLNGIGNGVTLANFSEFSGFFVGNPSIADSGPTGDAVFGGQSQGVPVNNVVLSQNVFANNGGNGLHFDNAGSNIFVLNSVVSNPDGIGMLVENGTPGITFGINSGLPIRVAQITNTGDVALLVRDINAGSTVNLLGSSIDNTSSAVPGFGQGILIQNVAGNVTIGDATIRTPDTFGIQIDNLSGVFTGAGSVSIAAPASAGISITNQASTGRVEFVSSAANGSVTISGRNDVGIDIVGNSGAVAFNGPVSILGIQLGNLAPAISWQGNTLTTSFNNITIVDSGSDGLALGTLAGNLGTFSVGGTVGISGTIDGSGIEITNNLNSVAFQGAVIIDGRNNQALPPSPPSPNPPFFFTNGQGIFIHDNGGTVAFNGDTTVQNQLASISPAVDIERNDGAISFRTLIITDATSAGTDGYGAGLHVFDNPATVGISEVQITAEDGIGIFVNSVGDPGFFQIGSGTVTATGLPAIDISDTVYNVRLNQVNSDTSAREGIRLVNNTGIGATFDFQVLGQGNTLLSGGLINNSAAEGVYAELAGSISLANMGLDSNLTGVFSLDNARLDMTNMQVSNSIQDGVLAIDTQTINIIGLGQDGVINFDSNGTAPDFHEITLIAQFNDHVTPNGEFVWTLRNNTIVHQSSNAAVLVTNRGFPAAANANLTFTEIFDEITVVSPSVAGTLTNPIPAASGITIDWTGTTDVRLQQNTYTLLGGQAFGIVFNAFSSNTANTTNVDILSNEITGLVGGNVGIYASALGPANININAAPGLSFGNIITFDDGQNQDGQDIGINIQRVGANSNVTIANTNVGAGDNQGFIRSDGAQAIAFNIISAPSTITIDNNFFTLIPVSSTLNLPGVIIIPTVNGINLGSVIGGDIFINGANNVFDNPTQAILNPFIPLTNPGNINGTIEVNGVLYPQ